MAWYRSLCMLGMLTLGSSSLAAAGSFSAAVTYLPPACSAPPYGDVLPGDPACRWIQQFKTDLISAGCGGGNYCPDGVVTRRQLAVALERSMRGTAEWNPWEGSYRRTLIVNPVLVGDPPQVDPSASGDRLVEVLASIPADSEEYLVIVEPGVYHVGDATIPMRSNLTLRGAGRRRTSIVSDSPMLGATFVGEEEIMTFADLSLDVVGGNGTLAGLRTVDGFLDLYDVDIDVANSGTAHAVEVEDGGTVSVKDSSLRATSNGTLAAAVFVRGDFGSLQMHRSTALGNAFRSGFPGSGGASRGVVIENGSAEIYDSRINAQAGTGTNYSLALTDSAQAIIQGGGMRAGGGTTAVALYIEDSSADVDGGEFVAYSGTNRRAAQCISTGLSGSLELVRVRLSGSQALRGGASCPIEVSFSQLQGAVVLNGGTVDCAAVTDSGGAFHAASCS